MLRLELLGPVSLRREGVALRLTVKKTLALLVLLARSGPMSRTRVVALLWPLLDERSGRRNLRRELARLRESGAAETVHAEGDLLTLSPQVFGDVQAFEAALAQGRPDDALAHWRGPPADGLSLDDSAAFDDWCNLERERLSAARQRALEASAAAAEARGDGALALQRVQALLLDDPLQEQRHRDAMRLLAALGRREAALAQFERCRALLKDELGLSPMAETEALAAALRGVGTSAAVQAVTPVADPAPAPGPRVTARLLPEQLPFVGRAAEIAALEAAWQAGRPLLIEGEAGLGKSRLATDFAAAHGPYARVRSLSSDKAVPYATFTRALRLLAGSVPELSGLPPWVAVELARLLPELSATAPPPLQSAAERNRFLEACTQGWLALADDSFDAVIFDDWHHADAASQALLGFIAQRRRELADTRPSAVRGGAREVLVLRPELDAESGAALRQLIQASDALHLRLAPLSAEAVFELVQRLSGVARPMRFAARLNEATAGNPFFLAETLRHLAEQQLLAADAQGVWHTPFDEETQDYRELPVPASVHEAVLLRVERLPASARRLLEAAALAVEPFAPALLAPACALSEMDAVLGIEAAVEARLLREHESGGFAFAHDLVQQAINAALSAERRRLVHRRLALGAEAANAPAATIAMHHEASGEHARAVAFRMAAGDSAAQVHAWVEAFAQWQLGLADRPTPSQAASLHRRALSLARRSGHEALGLAHARDLEVLAASATLAGDERADSLVEVARFLARGEQAPHALALLDGVQQMGHLGEHQQALALAARGVALRRLGRLEDGRSATLAALAMPVVQGEDRASMLESLVVADGLAGRVRESLAFGDALITLATQLGSDFFLLRGRYLRGTKLLQLGDRAGAEAELSATAERALQAGFIATHRATTLSLSYVYFLESRYAEVVRVLERAWALQPALVNGDQQMRFRALFVEAHLALGDFGAARGHALEALEEALSSKDLMCVAQCHASCAEFFALLDEPGRLAPLMAVMGDDALRQVPQIAIEVRLASARAALLTADPDGAARVFARIGMPADGADSHTRIAHRLIEVELALARGQASLALEQMPAHDDKGMSDELRIRALALKVRAETEARSLRPATVTTALDELGKPSPHALGALFLHQALAAAQRAGAAGAPPTAEAACAAHAARLAASLQGFPAQQAALARFLGGAVAPGR